MPADMEGNWCRNLFQLSRHMDRFRSQLVSQLKAASAPPRAAEPLDLARWTFRQQRDAILDGSRERVFYAGRRGGKTRAFCWCLILAAQAGPRQNAVYLSTSINRAVDTIWSELVEVLDDAKIPYTANGNLRTFEFANGSRIWVSGVETKKQANKIRGRIRRTAVVCIDEAQDWPAELLRYTYQVVLWPTLADVGGRTVIGGTGTAPRGWWYQHGLKADVNVHRWTMFDNTLGVRDARVTLEKAIRDKGLDVPDLDTLIASRAVGADPEVAQEYFCEFVASERQIFHLSRERNAYETLPVGGEWCYVIGADWGTVDKAAVAVWGWTSASPRLYLIAYEAKAGLSTADQIAMVMRHVDRYPPLAVLADPATGGSAFILDLQDRFGAPAEPAEKDGKVSAVLLMRDALRRGEVMLPASEWTDDDLTGEMGLALTTPEWDPEQVQKSIKGHMPDLVDAALYAFRKARQYDYTAPAPAETEEQRVLRQMREERAMRQARVNEMLGLM